MFTKTGSRCITMLGLLAVALEVAAPSVLRAQECIGVPAGMTVNTTALRNIDGGSRTWSVGATATYEPRRVFGVLEAGDVKSSARLLSDHGLVVSGGIGYSLPDRNPMHSCVMVGFSSGRAPSAPGVTGNALDGVYALAGMAYDLWTTGATGAVKGFASLQVGQSSSTTGTLLRAGVMYARSRSWYARGGVEWGSAGGATGTALSASLGYRIR